MRGTVSDRRNCDLLLVGGYFAYQYFASYESTDDAQVDGHLMPISARIPGYIIRVNVDDNQYVQQGAVCFAEIDPHDYQIALEKAQADPRRCAGFGAIARINVPITSISALIQPGFRVTSRRRKCASGNFGSAAANGRRTSRIGAGSSKRR